MMTFSLNDVYSSIDRVADTLPVENLSNRIRFAEHKSIFRDRGEFYQFREYDPEMGDLVSDIEWRKIGPDGKLYVRIGIPLKEFQAVVMADLSSSMTFEVDYQYKERMLLEAIGDIGLTCVRGQDSLGLMGFAENIIFDEEPRVGSDHVDYLIEQIYRFFEAISSDGKGRLNRKKTDFVKALKVFYERYANKQCFLVVISDFVGAEELINSQVLKDVANQHEVVFLFLDDLEEFNIGWAPGFIRMEDMETGKRRIVSTRMIRKENALSRTKRKQIRKEIQGLGIDSMVLEYGKGFQRLYRVFDARRESLRK